MDKIKSCDNCLKLGATYKTLRYGSAFNWCNEKCYQEYLLKHNPVLIFDDVSFCSDKPFSSKPKPKTDWTAILISVGLWGSALLLSIPYILVSLK